MACKCAPALLQLRKEFDQRWPGRDKASDGCCGDAAHAARKSDHNPVGGYAHAADFDENIHKGDTAAAPLLFLVPILLDDPRAKYVIYERRISYPDGTSKPYHGANAHEHHLHLSILPGATHDTRPWLKGPTTAPTEDSDLTPDQAQKLNDIHAALTNPNDPNNPAKRTLDGTGDQRDSIASLIRKVAAKLGVTGV